MPSHTQRIADDDLQRLAHRTRWCAAAQRLAGLREDPADPVDLPGVTTGLTGEAAGRTCAAGLLAADPSVVAGAAAAPFAAGSTRARGACVAVGTGGEVRPATGGGALEVAAPAPAAEPTALCMVAPAPRQCAPMASAIAPMITRPITTPLRTIQLSGIGSLMSTNDIARAARGNWAISSDTRGVTSAPDLPSTGIAPDRI